ncbi:hypothetical protein BD289DRAFT_479208 [Coniella lustricola]|uniref:Mid2 domain-containing protein n=1 Tax=Coniella lustricola TaxID=2025994 RepID=A0A2T3AJJ5_9PEZI|nr:hypothetical protein BD289DRAFT_479208 [Coniella lustricola]
MHSNHSFSALLLLISILCLTSALAAEARGTDSTALETDGFERRTAAFHQRTQEQLDSLFQGWQRSSTDICPANSTQCGNGLPSDFCCPVGNSCKALADNTTVLCCAEGETCASIEPITCDITWLNATAHPSMSVHTTNLTGELPTCGSGCCPFGYTCNVNESDSTKSTCALSKGSTRVTDPSTSSTASPSATTVGVSAATGTNTGLILATETPQPASTGSSSSGSSGSSRRIVGIAAGSAAAGVACIGGIIAYAFIRRKNSQKRIIESQRDFSYHNSHSRPTRPIMPAHSRSTPTLSGRKIAPPEPSPPPPPLPPKEPYQTPRRKRKSLLSWVPSIINRTPVELPATPVPSSRWAELERPQVAHLPYQDDLLGQVHELEADARWRLG